MLEDCGFTNSSDINASRALDKISEMRKYVEIIKNEKVDGKKVRKKERKDLGQISSQTAILPEINEAILWMDGKRWMSKHISD